MPRAKTIKEDSIRPNAIEIRQVDRLLDRMEESLQTTQSQNEHKDKQIDILRTRIGLICRQPPWDGFQHQSSFCRLLHFSRRRFGSIGKVYLPSCALANFPKEEPTLAYTHLQPAQLITVGKRGKLYVFFGYIPFREPTVMRDD